MGEAQNLTVLLSQMLAIPSLKYRVIEVDGYSTYDFDHQESHDKSIDTRAPYYLECLKELSGSEELGTQISYFRNITGPMRQLLKNTVLMDDKLIAYCHLVCDGSFTYMGPNFADGPSWKCALSGCAFLASCLGA